MTFTVICTAKQAASTRAYRSIPAERSSGGSKRIQVVVEDLQPATTYSVTVRALNRMGSGPESDPVTTITGESAPSAAPANVNCATLSSDAVQVSWTQGHEHLQGFRIFYKAVFNGDIPSSGFRVESKRVQATPITSPGGTQQMDSVLYGLLSYQNYSVQVSAINRAGNGPLSLPVICRTDENGP